MHASIPASRTYKAAQLPSRMLASALSFFKSLRRRSQRNDTAGFIGLLNSLNLASGISERDFFLLLKNGLVLLGATGVHDRSRLARCPFNDRDVAARTAAGWSGPHRNQEHVFPGLEGKATGEDREPNRERVSKHQCRAFFSQRTRRYGLLARPDKIFKLESGVPFA